MHMDEVYKMNSAIDILYSLEILDQLQVSTYPHMDDKNRTKTHRAYYAQANPEVFEKPKALSLKDVAKLLGNNNG